MFSKRIYRLKRAVYLTIILVVFLSSLINSAIASGENFSISGTKFLDLDSNGIKAPSEPGLAGYIIYLDANKNKQWDADELRAITEENGKYSLSGLSNRTYIIRESISNNDKFRPSSPKEGHYSINLTGNKSEIDFGNSMPSISDYAISILFGILALIFILFGLIALYKSWSELSSSDREDRRTRTLIKLASAFILLILGWYLLILLTQLSRSITGAETVQGSFALVTPVILTLLVFGAVLIMLYTQTKLQQKDEVGGMRRTMAGLLAIGLIAVVLFSLSGTIDPANENIVTQFIQLVGIVIAFYFGSKATEDAYKGAGKDAGEASKDLEIKDAKLDAKKIEIAVANKNKRNFTVNGVRIEDDKGNELINKDLTYPVSEANTEFSVLVTLTDEEIQTLSAAGDKDKQCKITIKTTIGDKTSTCKIAKGAGKDTGDASKDLGKDLEITKVTFDDSKGEIEIIGTKKNEKKFEVTEVSIKDDEKKTLIEKKKPTSINQTSSEFTAKITVRDEEKQSIKNAINKKCDITIKTSTGEKTTKLKLEKKED